MLHSSRNSPMDSHQVVMDSSRCSSQVDMVGSSRRAVTAVSRRGAGQRAAAVTDSSSPFSNNRSHTASRWNKDTAAAVAHLMAVSHPERLQNLALKNKRIPQDSSRSPGMGLALVPAPAGMADRLSSRMDSPAAVAVVDMVVSSHQDRLTVVQRLAAAPVDMVERWHPVDTVLTLAQDTDKDRTMHQSFQ